MFHKRKVDLSTLRGPDQKRFRHNVSNLFLTKTVSARRANELMKDAQIAGATGVKDLVKGAEKSGSGEKQANWEKNLARDMKRKMLKNCLWFNEYIALIPCYNPGKQAEEMKKIPFFLPHEILFVFSKRSEKKDLLQTGGMLWTQQETFGEHANAVPSSRSHRTWPLDRWHTLQLWQKSNFGMHLIEFSWLTST